MEFLSISFEIYGCVTSCLKFALISCGSDFHKRNIYGSWHHAHGVAIPLAIENMYMVTNEACAMNSRLHNVMSK